MPMEDCGPTPTGTGVVAARRNVATPDAWTAGMIRRRTIRQGLLLGGECSADRLRGVQAGVAARLPRPT